MVRSNSIRLSADLGVRLRKQNRIQSDRVQCEFTSHRSDERIDSAKSRLADLGAEFRWLRTHRDLVPRRDRNHDSRFQLALPGSLDFETFAAADHLENL